MYIWVLTTPWDITTAILLETTSTLPGTTIRDLWFSKNGLQAFTVDNDEYIDVHTLTKPFVISSSSGVVANKIIPIKNLRGITFNTNGSKMYVGANDGGEIQEHTIKRGWR